MLRRFGKTTDDLIPHNIIVYDFYGKTFGSYGLICLYVFGK